MVRVQVTDNSYCSKALTMFKLNPDLKQKHQRCKKGQGQSETAIIDQKV